MSTIPNPVPTKKRKNEECTVWIDDSNGKERSQCLNCGGKGCIVCDLVGLSKSHRKPTSSNSTSSSSVSPHNKLQKTNSSEFSTSSISSSSLSSSSISSPSINSSFPSPVTLTSSIPVSSLISTSQSSFPTPSSSSNSIPDSMSSTFIADSTGLPLATTSNNSSSSSKTSDNIAKKVSLRCPICNVLFNETDEIAMDKHIDECLSADVIKQAQSNTPGTGTSNNAKKVRVKLPNEENEEEEEEEDEDEEEFNGEEQEEEEEEEESEEMNVTFSGSSTPSMPAPSIPVPSFKIIPTPTPISSAFAPTPFFSFPSTPSPSFFPLIASGNTQYTCPYYCGTASYTSNELVKHIKARHKYSKNQKYTCPLCNNADYHINKNTNLYQHIRNTHSDSVFASPASTSFVTSSSTSSSTTTPTPTALTDQTSVNFAEEILSKDLSQECTICFEPFSSGDVIARLECLCFFHKPCLQQWLQKAKRCPLHEKV